MNGNKLLVDTNIVLYFLKGNLEINQFIAVYNIVISFITELELLSFGTVSPDDEQTIKDFLNYSLIIDINSDIKSHVVKIRKVTNLKLPDAIIAATAISMDLPLLTADRAFSKIKDPRIILYEL
jgi:predicted nucleic acid-binding protein